MNLRRLQEFIRFEAGIQGTDTLTGFINMVLNEVLREYTALDQYQELKVINASLNPTALNAPTFNLPDTLQHFIPTSVRYSDDGDIENAVGLYEGDVSGDMEGTPFRFARVNNQIVVYPQTVGSTATLFIDYYRFPVEMVAPTDVFPLPIIETTVKTEAVARLSRLSSSDKSEAFQRDAKKSFSKSQAAKQNGM